MSTVPEARPKRVSPAEAAEILAPRDPILAGLIEAAGPIRIGRRTGSHFAGLVEAIVYQQLAGAAAAAIHRRLVASLNDDVQPEVLLALSDETLRAVGLSANKARSLRDLASKVLDGTVILSPRGLSRQSDEEVIARLSSSSRSATPTAPTARLSPGTAGVPSSSTRTRRQALSPDSSARSGRRRA